MTVVKVTDTSSRGEIVEALGNLSRTASREFPVVGTASHPTPWDRRHRDIDEKLDEMDAVGA